MICFTNQMKDHTWVITELYNLKGWQNSSQVGQLINFAALFLKSSDWIFEAQFLATFFCIFKIRVHCFSFFFWSGSVSFSYKIFMFLCFQGLVALNSNPLSEWILPAITFWKKAANILSGSRPVLFFCVRNPRFSFEDSHFLPWCCCCCCFCQLFTMAQNSQDWAACKVCQGNNFHWEVSQVWQSKCINAKKKCPNQSLQCWWISKAIVGWFTAPQSLRVLSSVSNPRFSAALAPAPLHSAQSDPET